jgi:ERCC4-type nuclease
MFYVDVREQELIGCMEGKEGMIVKQLPVGDIWMGMEVEEEGEEAKHKEGGWVIERKTIQDWEASILDGRYREQRGRILAYCQEHKTRPVYLLEGSWENGTGRLGKKALMKFMNRLIFHYQIPVFFTSSCEETAEWLVSLQEQWKETDPQKSIHKKMDDIKVTDGIHIQKKVNAGDPTIFAITCLAQCPGVSVKMAEAILQEHKTLQGVMEASIKQVESVKVGNRKVGPVVAKRLLDLLKAN